MRPHLASLVEDLRAHPDETAVVAHRGLRRHATSYGALAGLAGRFAAELTRRGIGPGERVVLWGANSAEWIAAFFGCLLRGVLAVPLDVAGSPDFAARVLAEVAPRLIVADAALRPALPTDHAPAIPLEGLRDSLPKIPDYAIDPSIALDTPFQIVFTSGTTSAPKGVVHTHRNVLASLAPIEQEIAKYRRYERPFHPLRFLHTLPLSHVFGQFMGLWIPVVLAAELHFSDAFEPRRTVALIRRERISVLIAVPRVLTLLRAHLLDRFPTLATGLERRPPARFGVLARWWRFRAVHRALGWKFWAVISGGAALQPELERFWNQLGYALIQGYGMTETAALVTLNHPFRIGRGTIGRPLPGREIRLSETGEILVRGAMVATATWQHGALKPRTEEWLATGDLAEQTASGEYRFLGRAGESIVTANGVNVHPADLEAALLAQPGVRGCAAVPCTMAGGVEPVAVVLFPGEDAALAEAVRHANAGLAGAQQIRRTLRWPELELPYTSTGKLLRRVVRDWACATLASRAAGQTDRPAQADPLLALITGITGATPTRSDDALRLSEDLYLDSLGRVQLASAVERHLGIALDEQQAASLETLGDLRHALGGQSAPVQPQTSLSARTPTQTTALEAKHPSESHLYPRWPWSRPMRFIRTLSLELLARPLIASLLAPRVAAHAPLPAGPFLIIANHVTLLDGALVLYALPPRLRHHVAIAMSGEMLLDLRAGRAQPNALANRFAPLGYWLVTALFNVFPLPRLQGFQRAFAHAGEALDTGQSVLVFPEGRRNPGGTIGPFRQGIGLLAAGAAVPVLPVALIGLEALRPGPRHWLRSGRLQIRLGKPITLPPDTPPTAWTTRLEQELRQLAGES